MDDRTTQALAAFSRRRFGSFSEAAETMVGALSEALPGSVFLLRLEAEVGHYRVIELRGPRLEGLEAGSIVPGDGDRIDVDFLRTYGAQAWITVGLETRNGRVVGTLCAADESRGVFRPEHEALLGVAARMLGHEWENVELRAELRRLRRRGGGDEKTDPDTGLPNRERFLELLEHEWRLVQRGTVQSVLVACRVSMPERDGADAPGPRELLALKVAAEVLEGATRTTDRVGRLDEATVGAVLVGCPPEDTPSFMARFLSSLERVSGDADAARLVSCGVQLLAGTSSAEEALALAVASAQEQPAGEPITPGTGAP